MKITDKIKPLHLAVILGAIFILIMLFLFFQLASSPKQQESESLRQEIPDADVREDSGTKTEGYSKDGSNIEGYWDSCDRQFNPEENTAPLKSGPSIPTVEELFKDGPNDEPKRTQSPKSKPSAGTAPKASQASSTPKEEEAPPQAVPKAQVRRSGSVSSLDGNGSDLGSGFSTLDGTETYVSQEEGKPYSCMFTRDEKVKSGQRITLRLLEDLVISGVHIPRNTHLQGVCTISERMEINVTSLDMGGRILKFHFEAFDTDGGKGIYCSDLSKTAKEAADQGINTVTSSLNGRLGRVARDAATLGASIIRSKTGEVSVSIPAGYTFYLVEKKR